MAVNFYLEKRTDKSGDAPIRVSVTICGVRLVTSIGYSINPTKWDSNRQKVRQGNSNSKGVTYNTINARMNTIDSFFMEYNNDPSGAKTDLTTARLKEVWSLEFGKSNSGKMRGEYQDKTLLYYFDKFVADNSQSNDWAVATCVKFNNVRNHITGFVSEPTFESFNKKGLTDYVTYLRDVKDLRNTTITKHISMLRWFLRWTTINEYNENTDYTMFKPKFKTVEKRIVFLSWDELMTVYNYPIPATKIYLERVRDVFCFCCFTSLRYSDAYNLKRSDIIGDTLHITTVKTSDSLIIELNNYSRSILDKYAGIPFERGKALPVISNQKMNDYLKELGKMCGINEPQTVVYFKGNKRIEEVYPKYELLGTHAGRRTFICNALALGIPAQVVMKWTGHSDYKAMKPYIDIADSIKAQAMSKFNEV